MAVRLFDEKDWENVSDENMELFEDYMLELESQNKAVKTIYQYKADIRGLLCWLVREKHNKYILDLKRRDFRNFFLKLQRAGTSSSRVNRFQSSIRNLLEYACVSEDYPSYKTNEMAHIKGLQKEPRREIVFLTDQQVNILIDELLRRKHFQKALWVSLAYDSAARRNEIHQVTKEGFLENNQTNIVTGKRGKKFRLLYFERTKIIFKLWLKQRGDDDLDTLWVSNRGGHKTPLSYESTYSFVDEFREILKARTGEDIPVTPHSFRHSSLENYSEGTHHTLTEMGKDGLEIHVLQAIAHHESSETTEIYLKNKNEERLAEAFGLSLS